MCRAHQPPRSWEEFDEQNPLGGDHDDILGEIMARREGVAFDRVPGAIRDSYLAVFGFLRGISGV